MGSTLPRRLEQILALIDHGVVALPIHDALVVPSAKVALAKKTMLAVFKVHTGVHGVASVEGGWMMVSVY